MGEQVWGVWARTHDLGQCSCDFLFTVEGRTLGSIRVYMGVLKPKNKFQTLGDP